MNMALKITPIIYISLSQYDIVRRFLILATEKISNVIILLLIEALEKKLKT